jgi:transcriptional regulator with XRE-family HTH domain
MRGLRKVMIEIGIWSTELARRTKLIPNTINNYVNGKTVPNVLYAHKIAKALGVSMDYIWGEDKYKNYKDMKVTIIKEIIDKYCNSSSTDFLNFLVEKKKEFLNK